MTRDPGLWNVPVGYVGVIKTTTNSVPEPTTLTLLSLGLLATAAVRRRRGR